MGLQHRRHLLQDRHRPFGAGSQAQGGAVIADMPMGAPGAVGGAPLMMGRDVAGLAHKAKRGLLREPGEPRRRLRLKGKQALFGADDHGASLTAPLDAGIDVNGRAGRRRHSRGRATSAGSRGCGPGGLCG
jgi:hypothetical protein